MFTKVRYPILSTSRTFLSEKSAAVVARTAGGIVLRLVFNLVYMLDPTLLSTASSERRILYIPTSDDDEIGVTYRPPPKAKAQSQAKEKQSCTCSELKHRL